jgi:transcriptional regulator of acetoin/glycerol metabolism
MTLEEMTRQHIVRVLALEHGSVVNAAKRLGVSRSALYEMLKRFGIQRGRSGAE